MILRERVLTENSLAAEDQAALAADTAEAKPDFLAKTSGFKLQGRHLEYADFSGSSLPNADLRRTHLRLANFHEARLDHAHLESAHLPGADLAFAQLPGADLSFAHFAGTLLEKLKYQRLSEAYITQRVADFRAALVKLPQYQGQDGQENVKILVDRFKSKLTKPANLSKITQNKRESLPCQSGRYPQTGLLCR